MDLNDFKGGIKQTSIDLPSELWILAKQNLIEFKTALIFGIRFKIAEKEGFDYPQNKLSERIAHLSKIIQEKTEEIEDLKNKLNPKPKDPIIATADQIEDEIKKVLGDLK